MSLSYVRFDQVSLADPFFGTLKADYAESEEWFAKKAANMAYLSVNDSGAINGFLYLKFEDEAHDNVQPSMPSRKRLKVGTFKIDAHGTKLGDRFVKKLFDQAMAGGVEEVYVTVFEKHSGLIKLLQRYGFEKWGTKASSNGTELVLVRPMEWSGTSLHKNYPLVNTSSGRKFLLALYPEWHTRLLPDSKLINEGPDVVKDISHTNSIQKIYLAGRSGAQNLQHGDALVIYRTSDNQGAAYYRSVATSVCIVDKVETLSDYATESSFLEYCLPFSVFTEQELKDLYKTKNYPVIITFTYNISFAKRLTRKVLLEEVGISAADRWTCLQITDAQFNAILAKGLVNENFVVDQA